MEQIILWVSLRLSMHQFIIQNSEYSEILQYVAKRLIL